MASYKEISAKVTEKFIALIEENKSLPWVKPWKGGNPLSFGAVSYTTGKPYSFVNQLMLGGDGEWLTFNKCKELGGTIKKGSKGHTVYFAKTMVKKYIDEEGNEQVSSFPIFQSYVVFSVADCEGIAPKWHKEKTTSEVITNSFEDIAEAEDVINAYVTASGITFENNINSNSAFYSPSADRVVVPNKEQFKNMVEYYSTTFHELTHSTLKPFRCNRPQDENGVKACFGNAPYAKEELVAELGASFILTRLNIATETTMNNSGAYLQSWLKALKDDTTLLFSAATKAEKATKFIFGEVADDAIAA